jgi:membrane-associated PAP2 superfamily phosphatase
VAHEVRALSQPEQAERGAGAKAQPQPGAAFSLLRLAQGAHFMSHNLWSAVIDLCMAALCFAPLLLPRAVAARPVGVVGTRYAP